MKKIIYWLMGEKAGFTIFYVWHWLWGLADLDEDYKRAREKYESKLNELQILEKTARYSGDRKAAQIAQNKVSQIEQVVLQLEQIVIKSEVALKAAKEKPNREQMELENNKTEDDEAVRTEILESSKNKKLPHN